MLHTASSVLVKKISINTSLCKNILLSCTVPGFYVKIIDADSLKSGFTQTTTVRSDYCGGMELVWQMIKRELVRGVQTYYTGSVRFDNCLCKKEFALTDNLMV